MSGRSRGRWLVVLALVVGVAWWASLAAPDAAPAGRPRPSPADAAPGPVLPDALARGEPAPLPPAAPGEAGAHADDAAPAAHALRGIVTDRHDAPFAGATVSLVHRDDPEDRPLSVTTTGADGRFQLAAAHEPAQATFTVSAEGHVPFRRTFGSWPDSDLAVRLFRVVAVSGRVLDAETGAPLAGARLSYRSNEVVTSDEAGRYRLEPVHADLRTSLHVQCAGYVPAEFPLLVHGPHDAELDLRLSPGRELLVEVVDAASGAPIAGAEVRARRHGELLHTTDALGRFTHTVGADGFALHVSAAGHAAATWRTSDGDVPPSLQLPLLPPAWVAGRITDASGAPVPARVLTRRDGGGSASRAHDGPGLLADELDERATAGEDGAYRLGVVPSPAPFDVHVLGSAHLDHVLGPFVLDGPGATLALDVVLEAGGTIRGTVRLSGEPLVGAFVTARDAGGAWLGQTQADRDGEYELTGIAPGQVEVSVDRVGCEPARLLVRAGEVHEVDLPCAVHVEAISGRVTDASGQPEEGATVFATAPAVGHVKPRVKAETDGDGRYRLPTPAGHVWTVSASQGDVREATLTDIPSGARDVDLVLPAAGALRLRLVDADTGQPLPAAATSTLGNLSWRPVGGTRFQLVPSGGRTDRNAGKLDVEGVVVLRLPVGLVDVSLGFQHVGYPPQLVQGLRVEPGEPGPPVTVELQRGLDARLALSGPADRRPLDEHVVFLVADEQLDLLGPATADAYDLRLGDIPLRMSDPSLFNQLVPLHAGDTPLVRGLRAGRYTLVAFPDDLAFEPHTIAVTTDGATHPVRWSLR